MNTQMQKIEVQWKKEPDNAKEELYDMRLKLESITAMFYELRKKFGKPKEDSKIDGDVEIDDGSGSIHIDGVSKDVIIIDSGSGGVDIDNVKGKVYRHDD